MIYATTMALVLGPALDLLLGDPRWLPHPIRGIGLLIQAQERLLRPASPAYSPPREGETASAASGGGRLAENVAGLILVVLVLLIVVAVVILSLYWGGIPAAAYWIFTCLAVLSVDQESQRVGAAV